MRKAVPYLLLSIFFFSLSLFLIFSPPQIPEPPPLDITYQVSSLNPQDNQLESQLFTHPLTKHFLLRPVYLFSPVTNISKLNPKDYLQIENIYYSSPGGRGELNENLRELCVQKYTSDPQKWQNFILTVNQNCTTQNIDLCWQDQASNQNLDLQQINTCFITEASKLITSQSQLQPETWEDIWAKIREYAQIKR